MLQIRAGSRSVTGNYRGNNEDRLFRDDAAGIWLVADGMGGQLGGEMASQMAVDIIAREVRAGIPAAPAPPEAIKAAIRRAFVHANEEILVFGSVNSAYQNLGTTAVLALAVLPRLYVAGIGDSRAYLFRGPRTEQLTTDHTLAQALVEARTIPPEEAQQHRYRHVLWRYLGSKEVGAGPSVEELDLKAGDRLLLASDGLTGVVRDEVLAQAVCGAADPQVCADQLVNLAIQSQSKDNITVITLFVD